MGSKSSFNMAERCSYFEPKPPINTSIRVGFGIYVRWGVCFRAVGDVNFDPGSE